MLPLGAKTALSAQSFARSFRQTEGRGRSGQASTSRTMVKPPPRLCSTLLGKAAASYNSGQLVTFLEDILASEAGRGKYTSSATTSAGTRRRACTSSCPYAPHAGVPIVAEPVAYFLGPFGALSHRLGTLNGLCFIPSLRTRRRGARSAAAST